METKTKKWRGTFHFNFALALRQLSIAPSRRIYLHFHFHYHAHFSFHHIALKRALPFLRRHVEIYEVGLLYAMFVKFYVLGHHRKKACNM